MNAKSSHHYCDGSRDSEAMEKRLKQVLFAYLKGTELK